MYKLLMLLALVPSLASAAPSDCPHEYKPKVHKPRPKPPVKPAESTKCDCLPGPRGPQGPQGEPGRSTTVIMNKIVHDQAAAQFPLAAGIFATYFANGDWAWGPALEIGGDLSKDYEATLMGGLAMGASDDRESGWTARAEVARKLDADTTLGFGLGHLTIDGSSNNGQIDGDYLTVDVGVSIKRTYGPLTLRLNLMPVVIGFLDDTQDGRSTQFGSSANLFGGARW